MTTPHRTLLQQALDALLTGYHQGTQDAIAALREALAADHLRDVAEKVAPDGWVMVPREATEAMMDAGERAFVATARPGVTWAEHTGSIYRAMIAAATAQPAVRHVRKVGGSFQHTGTVVAEFRTTAGEPRIVLEFDAPVAGMLHVYRPDQVEPCEPAAPAQPAVPLTEGRITGIANELAFGGGHCNVYELARAIERAHGTGVSNG